jgi:hypothetical protein
MQEQSSSLYDEFRQMYGTGRGKTWVSGCHDVMINSNVHNQVQVSLERPNGCVPIWEVAGRKTIVPLM